MERIKIRNEKFWKNYETYFISLVAGGQAAVFVEFMNDVVKIEYGIDYFLKTTFPLYLMVIGFIFITSLIMLKLLSGGESKENETKSSYLQNN